MKSLKLIFVWMLGAVAFMTTSCGDDEATIQDTDPPMISILAPEVCEVMVAGNIHIQFEIIENNEIKEYEIMLKNTVTDAIVFELLQPSSGQNVTIDTILDLNLEGAEEYELSVTVSDQHDNVSTETALVDIVNAPALALNFKVQYDGVPVVMSNESIFTYPGGNFKLFFTNFNLFLSEITLLNGTSETLIDDVAFLKLSSSFSTEEAAEKGAHLFFPSLDLGDFTGIRFGLGVPEDMNAMRPSDFPFGHPLANSGEHWLGWDSYIFHKTEGKIDMDGDGEFERSIALHVGSNDAYRVKDLAIDFVVEENKITTLEFVINLKDIFEKDGQVFDIETTAQIHNLNQIDAAIELAENLTEAIY